MFLFYIMIFNDQSFFYCLSLLLTHVCPIGIMMDCFLRMHAIRIGWLAGCGDVFDICNNIFSCLPFFKLEKGTDQSMYYSTRTILVPPELQKVLLGFFILAMIILQLKNFYTSNTKIWCQLFERFYLINHIKKEIIITGIVKERGF